MMNKRFKRLVSVVAAVIMVMTMLPVFAAAEPVYTDWNGDPAAIVDGAYLKLTADKDITEVYNIEGVTATIDLNGNKITSSAATQIFSVTGGSALTVKNGTIEAPGAASGNGGLLYVYNNVNNTGANSLTLDGVTVNKTAGTSDLSGGGILYARGNVNLINSTLQFVSTEGHDVASFSGGIVRISTGCTLTIDNSTLVGVQAVSGGTIFAEGSAKVVINSGSIIDGTAEKGDAIYTGNKNASITINGGTIGAVWINKGKLYVNGGTIEKAWYIGKTDCVQEVADGVVFYKNPASYVTGCEAYVMDKSDPSQTKYKVYAELESAIAAAQSGNTVSLLSDVTADEVLVPAGVTLNLYGKTLTANAVNATAAGAQIKDEKNSKNAGGKLVCSSVTVAADNAFAPINYQGEYHFQKFAITEKAEGNTYQFYIADAAEDVLLDELWASGSEGTGVKLEVYVTWKENGNDKYKAFEVGSDLVAQYVANWDTKAFKLTITSDLTNITDLTCTARVVVA